MPFLLVTKFHQFKEQIPIKEGYICTSKFEADSTPHNVVNHIY